MMTMAACSDPKPGSLRVRLLDLLQATEAAPRPDELAALATEPVVAHELCAIADDEVAPPLARTRALYVLRAFPSAESRALLHRFAKAGATEYARALAARSLAAQVRCSAPNRRAPLRKPVGHNTTSPKG